MRLTYWLWLGLALAAPTLIYGAVHLVQWWVQELAADPKFTLMATTAVLGLSILYCCLVHAMNNASDTEG